MSSFLYLAAIACLPCSVATTMYPATMCSFTRHLLKNDLRLFLLSTWKGRLFLCGELFHQNEDFHYWFEPLHGLRQHSGNLLAGVDAAVVAGRYIRNEDGQLG